jgi:PKD repeat protein
MISTIDRRIRRARILAVLLPVMASACGLESQREPALTAPSEFGLSVTLTAVPNQLPRDGSSQSVVTVVVRDAQSRPVDGQRLSISTNSGRVSQSEVVTGTDGRATFAFTAPSEGTAVSNNEAIIRVVPVGTDSSNARGRSITILLLDVSNTTRPTPSFTFTPAAPVIKQPVVFDASATTDEGVTCGDACAYSWDFGGEATRTGRVVTYEFQAIKAYAVKLTVTDAAGSTATLTDDVPVAQGTAPTASFTFAPSSPGQFETIRFTAEASRVGVPGRTITSYSWTFGDGASATGMIVSKSFNVIGTFPVVLTITDNAGVQGTTSQNVVVSSGVTADFTISPTNPAINQTVILNAEASKGSAGFAGRNPITKYIWNFGVSTDTEEKTTPITSTSFPTAKTYTINLTVEDSAGRRGTTSKTVSVSATSSSQ